MLRVYAHLFLSVSVCLSLSTSLDLSLDLSTSLSLDLSLCVCGRRLYGPISRDAAEQILRRAGLVDGNFIVREKEVLTDSVTVALSYSYNDRCTHHLLQKSKGKEWLLDQSQSWDPCMCGPSNLDKREGRRVLALGCVCACTFVFLCHVRWRNPPHLLFDAV